MAETEVRVRPLVRPFTTVLAALLPTALRTESPSLLNPESSSPDDRPQLHSQRNHLLNAQKNAGHIRPSLMATVDDMKGYRQI